MLAQATGIYRERPVSGSLRHHFACAWVHRLPATGAEPILVVPDGSIDLQWVDGVLRIAGPDREPQTEALAPGAIVVGFRFGPGHAAEWLGLSAAELLNRRIPLDEIWGREASRLAEEVGAARGIADLVQRLEHGLVQRAAGRAPSRSYSQAAYRLLTEGAPPRKELIPWLADELALSERTLRRRFGEAFGYGPKTLDRILRFQRFLTLLRGTGHRSLAELAAVAGYADQAHLTRESRRLAGGTPGEIAALLADKRPVGPPERTESLQFDWCWSG